MISVVIPTYNRASLLEAAIDSVLRQTRLPEELIVVDDGSTDTTRELVESAAGLSTVPIVYLFQENLGAAAARNTGIKAAVHPFIAFLDSDDQWLAQKLEKQLTVMEDHPEYPVSHTREIWYRNGRRVNQKKKHDPPHGHIFEQSLRMCVVGMSTVMVSRDAFQQFGYFDEQLPCCEDYDLWLRMSCKVPFFRLDEPLISKDGGRTDQLSSIHRLGMDIYRIQSLENLLTGGQLTSVQKAQAFRELKRKCTIYGQGCLKHGRPEEGGRYLDLPARIQHKVQGIESNE